MAVDEQSEGKKRGKENCDLRNCVRATFHVGDEMRARCVIDRGVQVSGWPELLLSIEKGRFLCQMVRGKGKSLV